MGRQCVICGKHADKDNCDCAFHYPKNETEARIWQRSMGAYCVSLNSILKQCCVCIEHIPQFVDRAQRQAYCTAVKSDEGECEKCVEKERPQLNVLLLQGASLPAYCENSQENASKDDTREADDNLDKDIFVQESSFKDLGTTCPDIDETEITVLRTPLHDELELQKLQEENNGNNEKIGDTEICTDVLLLGRSQTMLTGDCSCNCDDSGTSPLQEYCDQCPIAFSQLNEQELGNIIRQQHNRICMLEDQICRQNYWHLSMQQKMSELFSEFGDAEPIELHSGAEEFIQVQNTQHSEPHQGPQAHSSKISLESQTTTKETN